jgi:hypothetical protein
VTAKAKDTENVVAAKVYNYKTGDTATYYFSIVAE